MSKKFRLPKPFAEQWVAALRSGEYEQATGALTDGNGYCCLGVACRIKEIDDSHLEYNGTIPEDNELFADLPSQLKGDGTSGDLVDTLILMNDTLKNDFNEIADFIESEVELY